MNTFDEPQLSRKKAIADIQASEPKFDKVFKDIFEEFPYRTPKGFVKWDEIVGLLSFCYIGMHNGYLEIQDTATVTQMSLLLRWMRDSAPVYAISNELLRAFEATEILSKAGVLSNIPVVIPTLMLLLPNNALMSPEGGCIDHLVVSYQEYSSLKGKDKSVFDRHRYQFDFEKILFVACCNTKQTVWCTNIGINAKGEIYLDNQSLGANEMSAEDSKFVEGLRSLALQVLLAIAYTPDLLSEGSESDSKLPSKSHKPQKTKFLYPRWLGKDYKRPDGYRVRSLRGTHSSPRAHWRKAHPRWQPCGKNRQERKFVWIEPIKVNFK